MDRLTQIEADLASQIIGIDKSTQSSGYVYYNDVTTVNQEDESIPDIEDAYPFINIYMEPEVEVMKGLSRAFQSVAKFKLVCCVENDDEFDNARFTINRKMNEIYSDLEYNLSQQNATLGRTVDNIRIGGMQRQYNEGSNDPWRTANAVVIIYVTYSQSRMNPNINACV